jgi:hypothetical protein
MRYRLRTLLILLTLGPPVLAVGWTEGRKAIDAWLTPPPAPDPPYTTTLTLPTFTFPTSELPADSELVRDLEAARTKLRSP